MVRSSYSHPVRLSPGTPALLSRCSFDQWNSDPPLRRSPVFRPGGSLSPRWGCSLIGQPGWLRCAAPAGFLPAVAWTGESLLRTSPVLVSRGDVLSPLLVRLLSVGRRRSLVPGHRSRCLTAQKRAGFGNRGALYARPESGATGGERRFGRVRDACVDHHVRLKQQGEPPRWGKRPAGPFPSVGASCDARRPLKRPGGDFAGCRATAPEAPHVAAPGGGAGHQAPGGRYRRCGARIHAHCALRAGCARPGRRRRRAGFRWPPPSASGRVRARRRASSGGSRRADRARSSGAAAWRRAASQRPCARPGRR